MHTPGVIWTTLAMSSFSSVLEGEGEKAGRKAERRYLEVNAENILFHKSHGKVITVYPGSQRTGYNSFTKCQLMKGTMNLTNTYHFANSVLKCCNHGPEPLQFHKHIC